MDSRLPFKNLTKFNDIISKVNAFILSDLDQDDRDNATSFYKIDILCFYHLFQERKYSIKLVVVQSIKNVAINGNKKFILLLEMNCQKEGDK